MYTTKTTNQDHCNQDHVVIGPDGAMFCGGFKSLKDAQHTAKALNSSPALSQRDYESPKDWADDGYRGRGEWTDDGYRSR